MAIVDISPIRSATEITIDRFHQSVSGKALCVAMSASGRRVYLGGHSGVWRSDDGGRRWVHPERPQPPPRTSDVRGALYPPAVYDLLVSPANSDVVLAAAGRDSRRPPTDGIYRSRDAANSWERVHSFRRSDGSVGTVACLTVAPDDPDLMLAAGQFALGRSEDAGRTWTEVRPQASPGQRVWYVVCGPAEGGGRRVYALGSRVWYSSDDGLTWAEDPVAMSAGSPADGAGQSARCLDIHATDARTIYVAREAGELWRGRYPVSGGQPGSWTRLPSPPTDYEGTTASGTDFVLSHRAPDGRHYLIYSDRRTVHLAVGDPASPSDWTRIDRPPLHVDPHGIAVTATFGWEGAGTASGRIAIVNDGGAVVSTDGAESWDFGAGLSTLGLVNAAVLPREGHEPALVIQTGDNNGFFSFDGGRRWRTQDYRGGDNDCSFADPAQPRRLIVFAPRDRPRKVYLYRARPFAQIPDGSWGTDDRKTVPGPPPVDVTDNDKDDPNTLWNCVSGPFSQGYRPLVLTLDDQQPRPDGDFVTIWLADPGLDGSTAVAKLLRTTAMSKINAHADWLTNARSESEGAKVFQQGPDLPDPDIAVVQPSGGHDDPTFYVGDPAEDAQRRVWKWRDGMDAWQQIVPGAGANAPAIARRFFVDPYRPDVLYVLGSAHVHLSTNGGRTWRIDPVLEAALTQDGAYPVDLTGEAGSGQTLLRDMIFHPRSAAWRVAIGPAGVFQTRNARTWDHLLISAAAAMRPNNAVLDCISHPGRHDLYVATSNRGLLRVEALPPRESFALRALAHDCLGLDPPFSIRNDIFTGDGPQVSLVARLRIIRDTCP